MTTYFGFAIADSMFPVRCTISKRGLAEDIVGANLEGVVSCLNPSHKATINAMRSRFGIEVPIPDKAPIVSLHPGDSVIVMSVRGLPRLEGRHEYTEEEIKNAKFSFSEYTVH